MAQASSVAVAARPWGERLFGAVRLPPLVLGGALALGVILLELCVELAAGSMGAFLRGEAPGKDEEYRFSLIMALLIGYLPAAWAYAVAGSRRTLEALRPVLQTSEAELEALRGQIGRFDARPLRRAGTAGLLLALGFPFLVDLRLDVYDLRWGNTATVMHRLLLPAIGWMLGRFVYAVLVDANRLARLGRERTRVELLDLEPLRPFASQGLRNALLAIGMLSIGSLMLVDWGARPGLPFAIAMWLLAALSLATAGLLLPVRGVRAAIRAAKLVELAWCGREIRRLRDAHAGEGAGAPQPGRLADLVAYRDLVERVREWPFDTPILTRFALYLAIPLGSWLGGAVVERVVDAALR